MVTRDYVASPAETDTRSQTSVERRELLLDYAARTRHVFVRLLGATRWAKAYAQHSAAAFDAERRCDERVDTLDAVADDLWVAHQRVVTRASPPAAANAAVDALTVGAFTQFPRLPQVSIGIDHIALYESLAGSTLPSNPHHQIVRRLCVATRHCIRDTLAACPIDRLQVVAWRVGPAGVCVRIGVPSLWACDVSLDALDTAVAHLRCHRIAIFVASDPDAAGASQTAGGREADFAAPNCLDAAEEAVLCRLVDDRMVEAADAAAAAISPTYQIGRVQVMLSALAEMLTSEMCAPLMMGHLRAQAEALKKGTWSRVVEVDGSAADTPRRSPIVLRYWKSHRSPATLTISEYRQPKPVPGKPPAKLCIVKERLVVVTHDPPLPGFAGKKCFGFVGKDCERLSIEKLLGECVRIRSAERVLHIAEAVLRQRTKLKVHPKCLTIRSSSSAYQQRIQQLGTNVHISTTGSETLVVHLHQDRCTGIEMRVSARTGGLRVRPFGAARLVTPGKHPDSVCWPGDRHFKSHSEEQAVVLNVLGVIRGSVKLAAAARAVCALDIGVSNTLPPGTASVAATASAERAASQLVPPFAPLERRSPRRFLTLSPPPPAKESLAEVENSFVSAIPSATRNCFSKDGSSSKRPRLTYATTSDALVFIQESSFVNDDRCPLDKAARPLKRRRSESSPLRPGPSDMEDVDRYNGTAAAAAAWAVTRDVVERRLRRDSLLRAFVAANVASAAHTHHMKSGDDGALHLESASRVLLKVKCEPLPVRRAELLLRGSDAWQVRLSLLPPIFDSTDAALAQNVHATQPTDAHQRENGGDGNLWTVGVACGGSQLTFTYPSANAASVRSFFRDLTRARTAAALARGVPPSPFYRVLRRSPVRIVVGVGPFHSDRQANGVHPQANNRAHSYTATVEYVYSKGNSGGFNLSFSPTKPTMNSLAPLIEEALDASGGQVGGILAGLLERACPVAAAAESAVRERGNGRIRFVTALRVRAVFAGVEQSSHDPAASAVQATKRLQPPPGQVAHAVDVDARGGGGVVTVIDVGRATAVMVQQGFAPRGGSSAASGGAIRRSDFVLVPKWDDIVSEFCAAGIAEAQRAGSTVVLRMSQLERFLTALVQSVRPHNT